MLEPGRIEGLASLLIEIKPKTNIEHYLKEQAERM